MTTTVTKLKDIKRRWHLVDLSGQTLGRVSTRIAALLIGKHKPEIVGYLDVGDYVVAVNAAKVKVTGTKAQTKLYRHHTGHPGGFKEFTYAQVAAADPREIILHSVKGMLPKNKLRDPRLKRLKVFVDAAHPYADKFETKKN